MEQLAESPDPLHPPHIHGVPRSTAKYILHPIASAADAGGDDVKIVFWVHVDGCTNECV